MRALVTGASEGIGRSFCVKLAALGFSVTAVARTESRLKDLVQDLAKETGNGEHRFLALDLATDAGVNTLVSHLESTRYDLVINNAGFGTYGAFHALPDDFGKMLKLNIETLARLSHAYLRNAREGDSLINVSSMGSILPMPYAAIYSGTKGFVTNFTEALFAESKSRGIYVMCLCPGATRTLFQTSSGGKDGNMPRWATQSADEVVDIALKALRKRSKPVVRCGVQGWLSYLMPLISMKLYLAISERVLKRALAK